MNPFVLGGDLVPQQFVGRKRDIQILCRNMTMGRNWQFIAEPRRTGKSWLVRMAQETAELKGNAVAYLNLHKRPLTQELYQSLIRGVCDTLQKQGVPPHDVLQNCFPSSGMIQEAVTGHVMATGNSPIGLAAGRYFWEIVTALPKAAAMSKGGALCIVVDEFQELRDVLSSGNAESGKNKVLTEFRGAVESQNNISWIVLGSRHTLMEKLFLDKAQPLYRSFTRMVPSPIDTDTWRVFLDKSLTESGVQCQPWFVERLLRITGGHPYWTKAMCSAVAEDPDSVRAANLTNDFLDSKRVEVLRGGVSAQLRSEFDRLKPSDKKLIKAIAMFGGNAIFSAEFLERAGLTAASAQKSVKRLARDEGMLSASGSEYIFTDPLFKDWIMEDGATPLQGRAR